MRSLGIDNIGLALRLSGPEWSEIKNACQYKSKEGAYALIPDKIYFKPMGTFFLCDINVPKLVNGHNVLLADPSDLQKALRQCDHLLPIPIPLLSAPVQHVHFTYTEDSPFCYDFWRGCLATPNRGKWQREEQGFGTYFNGPRMRMLFYDKVKHLRSRDEPLPKAVETECEHDEILRIELRLDRAVLRQLKERGLWTLSSFLCSDLLAPNGFLALVRLFEWRASQFFLKDKSKIPLTTLEASTLLLSTGIRKFLKREAKSGRVTIPDRDNMEMAMLAVERREVPKELIQHIQKECERTMKRLIGLD